MIGVDVSGYLKLFTELMFIGIIALVIQILIADKEKGKSIGFTWFFCFFIIPTGSFSLYYQYISENDFTNSLIVGIVVALFLIIISVILKRFKKNIFSYILSITICIASILFITYIVS